MSQVPPVEHAIATTSTPDMCCTEWNALNLPCTNEHNASCRLLEHCRVFNEVLLGAGLELREDRRAKGRAGALIAVAKSSTCGCVLYGSMEDPRKAKALDLVECLLGQHHCITAVEFNCNLTQRRSLLQAVKRHCSLKSVTVWGNVFTSDSAACMFKVIKSLSQLESLAFKVYDSQKEWGIDTDMSCSSFDLNMYHLTTLDVADLILTDIQASRLVQELIENNSITDLAVGECVFLSCDKDSHPLFIRYLSREESTLQKLTLRSANILDSGFLLRELIEVFGTMNNLQELTVDIVLTRRIFIDAVTLFAEVVTQSVTLRTLTLPSTNCGCQAPVWSSSAQLPDSKAAQGVEPWLAALRKPNSALNQLCIDLRAFSEPECCAFFDAVAGNNALKLVIVNSLPCIDRLDRVSNAIREQRLNDRVVIKGHYMYNNTKQLQQCPQISSVAISASNLWFSRNISMRSINSALKFVGDCAHITTLWVNCDYFNRKAFSALAACLRGPSSLIDVDLNISHIWNLPTKQERRDVHTQLLSALASNLKLVRVSVTGVLLSDNDLKVLADGASESCRLIDLTITPACVSYAMHNEICGKEGCCFVHMAEAFPGTSDFKNMALADILEATRRNASAVSAAAQFVVGEQDGVKGARDMELMHDHPRLLEMVREGAGVSSAEAKKMISSAWLRVRRCSLEEFMRMAGVVKEKMECLGHPDARPQLSDINHDCWLNIRDFLKIADVLQN